MSKVKTTGQLRAMLAKAAQDLMEGTIKADQAIALHKIAKNISDSLYSETKIAMFSNEIGKAVKEMGTLELGDPNDQ